MIFRRGRLSSVQANSVFLVFLVAFSVASTPARATTAPRLAFVTQTPNPLGVADFATVTAAFGSHRGTTEAAPRGGSLHVLYEDGDVVDILDAAFKAACSAQSPLCDPRGAREIDEDGLLIHGVAVRDPVVHWDGDRILFAMSVGAVQYENRWRTHEFYWRLYEIEGLAKDATPVIREVPNQPEGVNNVSPVYGSVEGEIIFTTDLPVTGDMRHYPPLDEYESTPTVSGLWKLDTRTGALTVLDHAPSGAFDPFVDHNGHVIYTRWDHFQADQQANDALSHVADPARPNRFRAYTYQDEDQSGPGDFETVEARIRAALDAPQPDEERAFDLAEPFAPEPHRFNPAYVDPSVHPVGVMFGTYNGAALTTRAPRDAAGRAVRPFLMATFAPWQINQDGREHKSLRHIGRHELLEYLNGTFVDDPSLEERSLPATLWAFNLSEDPLAPGRYLANVSTDARRHGAGALLTMTDGVAGAGDHENANALQIDWLTDPGGDYLLRDPIALSDGTLITAMDRVALSAKSSAPSFDVVDFQLFRLAPAPDAGFHAPDAAPLVAPIAASFSYYEGGGSGRLRTFDGSMWALDPVEISARPRPPAPTPPVHGDFASLLDHEGVSLDDLEAFLEARDLAMIVIRNVTRRDDADRQQPYNLFVDHPLETQTASSVADASCVASGPAACLYGVRFFQLLENKLVRGYERLADMKDGVWRDNGRRGLARPTDHVDALDLSATDAPGAPPASTIIAPDGSVAMLAPARRAVTWQISDALGAPIVRERVWMTLQPGEVRVCNGCHGANELDQTGAASVASDLAALEALLAAMKANGLPSTP